MAAMLVMMERITGQVAGKVGLPVDQSHREAVLQAVVALGGERGLVRAVEYGPLEA